MSFEFKSFNNIVGDYLRPWIDSNISESKFEQDLTELPKNRIKQKTTKQSTHEKINQFLCRLFFCFSCSFLVSHSYFKNISLIK